MDFFGQHLFKTGGRDLILTYSEMDCMRLYQALDNKVPVVASLFGIVGLEHQYEVNRVFLNSFENIYLFHTEEDSVHVENILPKLKRITLPDNLLC